ncbi:MAG: hypothetical protein ACE5KE_06000 [Methanosarcinales archaeon]
MNREFINEVMETAREFPWIKRIDTRSVGRIVRIRLWINDEFIDLYYNSEFGTTSYAYIENGERRFGANNMKIGWHIHPYGEIEKHEPIEHLEIKKFLNILEKELKKRKKI